MIILLFMIRKSGIQSINYLLVIEYAGAGTLINYLKKTLIILLGSWDDKCNLAYQLACVT